MAAVATIVPGAWTGDGPTLVNPKHFDLGFEVIKKASGAVTTAKLRGLIKITRSEKKKLLEDKQLKQELS